MTVRSLLACRVHDFGSTIADRPGAQGKVMADGFVKVMAGALDNGVREMLLWCPASALLGDVVWTAMVGGQHARLAR